MVVYDFQNLSLINTANPLLSFIVVDHDHFCLRSIQETTTGYKTLVLATTENGKSAVLTIGKDVPCHIKKKTVILELDRILYH